MSKKEDIESPWNLAIRNNKGITNTNGLSNAISTTKYSLLTWLPVSMWEQFRRIANIYFILISILMLIGTYATSLYVSPLDPYSTVFTLVFVLMVTSVKEGYEDLQRYRSDKVENTRKVTIVRFEGDEIIEEVIESQYIKAGDIIKLNGKTAVSADLLLLMTSNYAEGNQCYIETANIDGETNLKVREAPPALLPICKQGKPSIELFTGKVEFAPPNKDIHSFIGALHLNSLDSPIPLSPDNILLRGSLFTNTDWAYATAIYTGQETKLQMNNRHADSKMSKIEGYLNTAIIIIFCAQVVLVSMSVISIYILDFQLVDKLPYVHTDGKLSSSVLPYWLEEWFVFFILYNNFIPISLYISIELVNVGQSVLIASDLNLYDEVLDLPCMVRSSNLAQELGLVSNVFSDKTGTLTRNEMKLVKFIVDGVMYDVNPSIEDNKSPALLLLSHNSSRNSMKGNKIYDFLQCLVTCHTVVREQDGKYRAESPDELALVEGAGNFNCFLLDRGTVTMNIEIQGHQKLFNILAVNAFNADRKRMSILVHDPETNDYYVMCKGADNIMLPLCSIDKQNMRNIEKSLLDLATLGLRTLCIAQKKLTTEQATNWLNDYKIAAASLNNRSENLAKVAAELESNMDLLGITAIEDRLQDEVPEVIADLAKAGIVLWMLTGDKEETAVNIGRSCNLLLQDTKLFFVARLQSAMDYNLRLEEVYLDITKNYQQNVGYNDNGQIKEVALVMDGPSFKYFDEKNLDQRKWLLTIGQSCRSVIACRLTPIQKQQLVALVKKDTVPRATTLSIGDGANDVSMIREADVGVGIFGKEGRQAANNADFAIGQFKFLRRLLLVHGRWNYSRQARVFLYCMHKNMVITLTLFWYSYFAAVSGTSSYESWVYTSFNFVLGLPIIFFGIMDRDLTDEFVLKHPQVYSTGRKNVYLTVFALSSWIINAIIYAVLICILFYYSVGETFHSYGLYSMGTTVFVGMCNALQLKVAFLQHQWTKLQAFIYFISVGGMLLYNIVVALTTDEYWYVANVLYGDTVFWLFGFFSVPLFTIMVDVFSYYLEYTFLPSKELLYYETEHIDDYEKDFLTNNALFKPKSNSNPVYSPPSVEMKAL